MDKIIVLFLVLDAIILISSSPLQLKSSPKDERIESLLKMSLPLIKESLTNSQNFDSFYKILFNNEENPESNEHKKTKIVTDSFESVKRKLSDDYGHLRFGRNDPDGPNGPNGQHDSKWNSRIKYNDPDYGHMRFG